MRQLTLAQCKALAAEAAEWDERTEAEYKDALLTKAQETHFAHCSASQLVKMWETGRNLKGRKLSDFEFRALCDAWVATFNSLPPAKYTDEPAPPTEITRPEPDKMLDMHDVIRLTGLSKSSIKRMVGEGRFPAPIKLSPRRNGWLASAVIEWRDTRPA